MRLPWSLLHTVLDHRRATPVPLIYLVSAAVGVVVGIGLEVLIGWRWWLFALSFVAAVWLLFLSSAFWGPYRVRLDDLLQVIDWAKAQARRHRRLEETIQDGSWMAYGIDGWAGPVALSAWGRLPSDGLTLEHGDRGHGVWIAVTTRTGDQTPVGVRRTQVFLELVAEEYRSREQPDIESIMRRQAEIHGRAREETPSWKPGEMRVDGVVTACDSAVRGDLWAAVLEVGGSTIEVVARGVDLANISLKTLNSLIPYFEGLKRHQDPGGG